MDPYFKELNIRNLSGKTILLDIDGTITTDGSSYFDSLVLKKIQEMSLLNSVFLFSNKQLPDRNNKIVSILNVNSLKTPFKKPNRKVISELPDHLKRNLIVIGDKVLTDGIFAKNIGADFIKVKRLISKNDDFKTKLTYLLDNIAGRLLNEHIYSFIGKSLF